MRAISEVERDTGLPRATIRMWERRYGFPAPVRDGRGERCYPDEQVEQLRLMRQLVQQGHRPAKLLAQEPSELRRLVDQRRPARRPARPRGSLQLLRLLRAHDAPALKSELEARLNRLGLEQFAAHEVAAMNRAVGDAWGASELEVHEEHLYSDCVIEVLRAGIARVRQPARPEAPQVLLTTFPQEAHGLGLLMAQAMFALQGCPAVSLGVRLPVEQIVASAKAYRADLIGLSFTGSLHPAQVQRGLEELRGLLPATIRIWAGGHCPVLYRRSIPGVRPVKDLAALPHLLAEDFALPPLLAGVA
jgi:DNA-binding transcriptional MerR regulator/methylmalonyl-CoA mutase cobalamin-binding subunit